MKMQDMKVKLLIVRGGIPLSPCIMLSPFTIVVLTPLGTRLRGHEERAQGGKVCQVIWREQGGVEEPVKGWGYELAETVHCMNETKKAFRLVIKREIRRQGELFEGKEGQYFYHVVATNWLEEEKNTGEVLKWHNQRGQSENFNKELKIGFGMERMSCGQTHANAVFFRIGVIAYNLFIGFKRLSCPESWLKQTIATFRWKVVQVAGRIVKHAGEMVLKLMIDLEKLELFRKIRGKSFELSLCSDG